MPGHADILDRPEPLLQSFWGSVLLHGLVLGSVLLIGVIERGSHLNIGDVNGGGIGGVMVKPVANIPLPDRGGQVNPVANDTESMVPEAPKTAPKVQPKVKPPSPNAIALKSDKAMPKRPHEATSQPNKWRDQQPASISQIYSTGGPRVQSPNIGMSGAGGVNVGNNSPFGQQFGSYAALIRDTVARNWKTSDVNPQIRTAPVVVVTFTIQQDGSVTNVRVSQKSGIEPLDISAQRAVWDSKFSALPLGFPKSQADVELKFELKR
jgi:periplasmic protein TonB